MSDKEKRHAVLEEFCPQRYRESPWQTIRKLAAEDMADEIVRLRGVLVTLRAEIDRLRDQLHLADQSARSSRAEAERIRAEIERILTEARAEINHLCQRADRAEHILAALPNPIARKMLERDGIDEASDEQWREAVDDANRAIRAAVTTAESEVGRE